jgi:4,5-dihydroxyphthalate decarboxylase
MKAFDHANTVANRQRMDHVADHRATGLISDDAAAALARPVLQHGVEANRKILETAADYSLEQGLTSRRVTLEEIFAPSTMEQ